MVLWRRRKQAAAGVRPTRDGNWILVGIWATVTLLVPTLMQTKLPWYLNPFYPAFALGIGWVLASALSIPLSHLSLRHARHAAAIALIVSLGIAEGRLVYYSYDRRDLNRSIQGLLLAEGKPMAGQRVFGVDWSRADRFVAKAVVGADPINVNDIDAFWRESRPGDYFVSQQVLNDSRLTLVRSNPRSHLHRRR